MTMVGKVSIIVSSFNYARFLPMAIDSALTQAYPSVEVIVVDDGSTDDSREVIARYGNRITAILKANGGQASALNAGFAVSQGDFVLFLDSDDALLPTAAATAAAALADPTTVKAHWPMLEIDACGRRTGRAVPPRPLGEGDLRRVVAETGPGSYSYPPTSGNAFPRWYLSNVLPIPERDYVTCPDFYLCELAPLFGTVARAAEPHSLYRQHGANNMTLVRLDGRMRLLEQCRTTMATLCQRLAIDASPHTWTNAYVEWLRLIHDSTLAIEGAIPQHAPYILVDADEIRYELPARHRALPFLERDGMYWGPPADDASALAELHRLREIGAQFVVFAWPAFWYLDHYPCLAKYLRDRHPCVLHDDRFVIFDLRA